MHLVLFLIIVVIMIFVIRMLGAWMLRIDEVIKELKEINHKL